MAAIPDVPIMPTGGIRRSLIILPFSSTKIGGLDDNALLEEGDVIFVASYHGVDRYRAWTYSTINKCSDALTRDFLGKKDIERPSILGRPFGVVTGAPVLDDKHFETFCTIQCSGNVWVNNIWDDSVPGNIVGFVLRENKVVPWILPRERQQSFRTQ